MHRSSGGLLFFTLTEPYSLTYGHFLKTMVASPVVHSDVSIKKEQNKFSLLHERPLNKKGMQDSTYQGHDLLYKRLCYSLNVYSFHLLIR